MNNPVDSNWQKIAVAVETCLEKGIHLNSHVLHYIDSSFSHPSPVQLQMILDDTENPETDSLLELLFFPDVHI